MIEGKNVRNSEEEKENEFNDRCRFCAVVFESPSGSRVSLRNLQGKRVQEQFWQIAVFNWISVT